MKNRKHKIVLKSIVLCLLVISCNTKKTLENTTVSNIPKTFSISADSINSGDIHWKSYFTDKYLTELIDTALKNNLDLKMAYQKMEAIKATIGMRQGALLPNLNASLSASQRKFGLYTMDGAGNISTEITPGKIVPIHLPDYYLGLQSSWEADVWGKLRNKKKAALSKFLSSVEAKNVVITDLIAKVATTYYELLALDNESDALKETIFIQENAYESVKVQKNVGMVNELAVKQLEAQVINSKVMDYEIRQRIIENETKINFLLNRYPQKINRDKMEFVKQLPFQVNVGIPPQLLKNRPDIREAEYNLVASKADAKAAKAAFYPSLNIVGGIGYQAFKTGFLFTSPESIAYSLIGSLVAPLINRSAIKAEFKTANALQQEALYNYQKTVLTGYTEVYNQVWNIKNLEKIVELKSNEVLVLSDAIDVSTELFKTGRANYIEVLMTQHRALEAKIELITAKQKQFDASINIYRALGGGWR